MKSFGLIVFDIDGTLTRSKLPLDSEMAGLICLIMEKHKVAIISGAGLEQFKWQILGHLSCETETMKNLYLLPTDGTVFCGYDNNGWCEYDSPMSEEEKNRIKEAFNNIFQESGLEKPEKIYGELIEDRGAQLNFSALGQDAPIELKEKWDSDNKKRERMVEVLKRTLPDFSMRIGGTTSIEITKRGIDKAYGLKKLIERTGVSKEEVLYIGDKLSHSGNDVPVSDLGIFCKEVDGPEETKKVIRELLK